MDHHTQLLVCLECQLIHTRAHTDACTATDYENNLFCVCSFVLCLLTFWVYLKPLVWVFVASSYHRILVSHACYTYSSLDYTSSSQPKYQLSLKQPGGDNIAISPGWRIQWPAPWAMLCSLETLTLLKAYLSTGPSACSSQPALYHTFYPFLCDDCAVSANAALSCVLWKGVLYPPSLNIKILKLGPFYCWECTHVHGEAKALYL